jgi:glycyl-tRNA synthetase beta chain
VPAKLAAVRAFRQMPEAEALATANKRIQNILKKAEVQAGAVELTLLQDGAERSLHDQWLAVKPKVEAALAGLDYTGALKALAGLREAVDRFFDEVMVMVDEPLVRNNRLALLAGLAGTMNCVADIGQLSGK